MKKNILTIIIMATTIANLVLTAVLVFIVMPTNSKTANLVDKVASVIDLEIESESEEDAKTPIEDLEAFPVATYESNANINLKKDPGDDANHYAVISGITVSFNKEADDYSKIKSLVEANTVYIEDIVKDTIGAYTISNISQAAVKEEAVKKIQERYDTKSIVEISLPGFITS